MWASDDTLVAFQYHFIRISSVFRYLSDRMLVLIWCYILAPELAASQLRASFAVAQFSRQMFLNWCALSYGVLSMLKVRIGPPPSSPEQVRAGSNLWLEGKRLGKRPQDGVGPACMQASAEGQLRSTGGCQGGGPLRKGLPQTGVRGRLCVGRRIGCWQQTPRTRIHGNGGTMAVAKS